MSDRTTTLRELFKAPEGQTLTGEQQLLYAKAYADAIAMLTAKIEPQVFVANLRATSQQYNDLADLVEQYLVAADHMMKDGKMDDEDEEEDEEDDNPEEEKKEKKD